MLCAVCCTLQPRPYDCGQAASAANNPLRAFYCASCAAQSFETPVRSRNVNAFHTQRSVRVRLPTVAPVGGCLRPDIGMEVGGLPRVLSVLVTTAPTRSTAMDAVRLRARWTLTVLARAARAPSWTRTRVQRRAMHR